MAKTLAAIILATAIALAAQSVALAQDLPEGSTGHDRPVSGEDEGNVEQTDLSVVPRPADGVTVPNSIFFLLDCSRTMGLLAGEPLELEDGTVIENPTRMEVALYTIGRHIAGIASEGAFGLAGFSNTVSSFAGGKLVRPDDIAVEEALEFAEGQELGGRTDVFGAIMAAMESGCSSVFIVTDGLPMRPSECDTQDHLEWILEKIAEENTAGMQINVLYLGVTEDGADFFTRLAVQNRGAMIRR